MSGPTYYAVVNDLIGGYDVSTHNKTVGDHGEDEWTLGSFMSRETAEEVAVALNTVQAITDASRCEHDMIDQHSYCRHMETGESCSASEHDSQCEGAPELRALLGALKKKDGIGQSAEEAADIINATGA